MFTLEIDGTAVAVINSDEATAKDLFTCDGFKDDIRTMTSAGKVLWDGTSPLTVRAASEDEIEILGRDKPDRALAVERALLNHAGRD